MKDINHWNVKNVTRRWTVHAIPWDDLLVSVISTICTVLLWKRSQTQKDGWKRREGSNQRTNRRRIKR